MLSRYTMVRLSAALFLLPVLVQAGLEAQKTAFGSDLLRSALGKLGLNETAVDRVLTAKATREPSPHTRSSLDPVDCV